MYIEYTCDEHYELNPDKMGRLTCNGVDWVDSKGIVQTYDTRPECLLGMISLLGTFSSD